MFQRSIDSHNLRYTGHIKDGDTQTHQSVVDAKPNGDTSIEKLECIGCLGTRLRNLVKGMRGGSFQKKKDCLVKEG